MFNVRDHPCCFKSRLIVSVLSFQWEFDNQDKNNNGILDQEEIEAMIIPDEHCMVGFMKSCDYDHQPGISRVEWNTCFPPFVPGECATTCTLFIRCMTLHLRMVFQGRSSSTSCC